MKKRHIVCGRFDPVVSLNVSDRKRLSRVRRIGTDRPALRPKPSYLPFSTDGKHVVHEKGTSSVSAFLDDASTHPESALIVLTRKEYFSILDDIALRDLKVSILEESYPIFPDIVFRRTLRHNLNLLTKLLKKVETLDIRCGSFSGDQSSRHIHRIARKLRFKNGFDRLFFHAYRDPYQEVFRLVEERPDRVIVALDFNSMFADCMKGTFCEPRSLREVTFDSSDISVEDLPEGVFHVVLSEAKESFFLSMHPFLFKRLNRSYRFNLKAGDSVELLLFRAEIKYYRQFFSSVEVKQGIVSDTSIPHPMANDVEGVYSRRLSYKAAGDKTMESYCRLSLQMMHSATNRRSFRSKRFDRVEDLAAFLAAHFDVFFGDGDELVEELEQFLFKNKYCAVESRDDQYHLTYLDIDVDSALYSISAKILANARIKLFTTIQRFLDFESVEICYSNVDSIHLSVKRSMLDAFLAHHGDLISDRIGDLKVQAIADKGYWFDLGRYWLKRNNEVVLFRNKNFNFSRAVDPFVASTKVTRLARSPAFSHIYYQLHLIENAFSYSKRLGTTESSERMDFVRFEFDEIQTIADANMSEANEAMHSKRIKIDLFDRIADKTGFGSTGDMADPKEANNG